MPGAADLARRAPAELLGVLSLAADLGLGQPMEHALRQCLISMRLAQQLGLDEADRGVVYYASLLAWVGCHVDAYEQAKWFGAMEHGRMGQLPHLYAVLLRRSVTKTPRGSPCSPRPAGSGPPY